MTERQILTVASETGLLHALSKRPQTEESAALETTRQTQLSWDRLMKKIGRSHTETHQAHVEGQLDCIFSVPMQHSVGHKLGEWLKETGSGETCCQYIAAAEAHCNTPKQQEQHTFKGYNITGTEHA